MKQLVKTISTLGNNITPESIAEDRKQGLNAIKKHLRLIAESLSEKQKNARRQIGGGR